MKMLVALLGLALAFSPPAARAAEPVDMLLVLAADLDRNPKLTSEGKKAAATLDADKWIDESMEIAKRYGYTKEVLAKVAAREGHSRLGPLDLSASYRVEAEEIAERRAVEAAHRLAGALQKVLQQQ